MKGFFKQLRTSNQSVFAEVWQLHRQSLIALGVFCAIGNLLMLVPTLYMLQVFDRVMVSRSELTLLAVSLVAFYMFGMLALTEWSRNRVLARISTSFDSQLSDLTFAAVFRGNLKSAQGETSRAFGDLNELRQFLSSTGIAVLLDVPWVPSYVVVLFLMHPALALLAIFFVCIQAAFAKWGQVRVLSPAHQAAKAQAVESEY